jgi:hypothetical protein
MLLFHRKFASCFKDTPTAPHYWKHAFESCYIFPGAAPPSPTAALATSAATAAFALWARDTNPSLQHWKSRYVWGVIDQALLWNKSTSMPHFVIC